MGDSLKGKVALVTGAGRGIGAAEAMRLAMEGAKVIVNDLGVLRDGTGADASPADDVVAAIKAAGGEAVANYDDITQMENGRKMARQAVETYGRYDILVNNAGIQINRGVFDITEEEFDRTIAIHIKGHWSTIRGAIDTFREQGGGCIINTASLAGLGQMNHVDYCAAKEGVIGLTRALALELMPYNIRVNNIRPRGLTRMITERRPEEMGGRQMSARDMDPTGREPDRVAQFVAFLASDAAKDVSGHDFFVQGNEISLLSLPQKLRSAFHDDAWDVNSIKAAFPAVFGPVIHPPVPY